MKAILVIDIDDYDIEELTVDYHLWREGIEECEMIHKGSIERLKPMPQKMAENYGNNTPTNTYIMNGTERQYLDMYAVGYNACIDEILEEEE